VSRREPHPNEWMGTTDAREVLGVSLDRLFNAGKIPAHTIGRVIRLRRVDVERARFLLGLESEVGSQQYLAP
jgi:hypothetical protein